MKTLTTAIILAFTLFSLAPSSFADKGFKLRLGVTDVNPDDSSGKTLEANLGKTSVEHDIKPSVNIVYYWNDRMGVELLASAPFSHNITLAGSGKIGEAKHLPPTLSFLYNIVNHPQANVYAGLGVNYIIFFEEDLNGPGDLELDNSIGVALQLGTDIPLSDKLELNASVRWINASTEVEVDDTNLGALDIDPWVYTLGINYNLSK